MLKQSIRSWTVLVSGVVGIAVGFSLWRALRSLPVAIGVTAGVALLAYVLVGNARVH